jgi:hypothetical protein
VLSFTQDQDLIIPHIIMDLHTDLHMDIHMDFLMEGFLTNIEYKKLPVLIAGSFLRFSIWVNIDFCILMVFSL